MKSSSSPDDFGPGVDCVYEEGGGRLHCKVLSVSELAGMFSVELRVVKTLAPGGIGFRASGYTFSVSKSTEGSFFGNWYLVPYVAEFDR